MLNDRGANVAAKEGSPGPGLRVLLLDDNPAERVLVARELPREIRPLHLVDVAGALAPAPEAGGFDAVITDYRLRWTDGLTVLRAVRGRHPDCAIMFTASGSEEAAAQAMREGLDDYVVKKPEHLVRLPAALRMALERGTA